MKKVIETYQKKNNWFKKIQWPAKWCSDQTFFKYLLVGLFSVIIFVWSTFAFPWNRSSSNSFKTWWVQNNSIQKSIVGQHSWNYNRFWGNRSWMHSGRFMWWSGHHKVFLPQKFRQKMKNRYLKNKERITRLMKKIQRISDLSQKIWYDNSNLEKYISNIKQLQEKMSSIHEELQNEEVDIDKLKKEQFDLRQKMRENLKNIKQELMNLKQFLIKLQNS